MPAHELCVPTSVIAPSISTFGDDGGIAATIDDQRCVVVAIVLFVVVVFDM